MGTQTNKQGLMGLNARQNFEDLETKFTCSSILCTDNFIKVFQFIFSNDELYWWIVAPLLHQVTWHSYFVTNH